MTDLSNPRQSVRRPVVWHGGQHDLMAGVGWTTRFPAEQFEGFEAARNRLRLPPAARGEVG